MSSLQEFHRHADAAWRRARERWSERKYIQPAARAVLVDSEDRVLLIRRSDNGMWALPAGGMEVGESVTDCMRREVWEETGLRPKKWAAYGVYSHPEHHAPNRPEAQLLTVAYRVDAWDGDLRCRTDETADAGWFGLEDMQRLVDAGEMMPMYFTAVEDCFNARDGGFVVV